MDKDKVSGYALAVLASLIPAAIAIIVIASRGAHSDYIKSCQATGRTLADCEFMWLNR